MPAEVLENFDRAVSRVGKAVGNQNLKSSGLVVDFVEEISTASVTRSLEDATVLARIALKLLHH